jgi:hypothetical protein
MFLSTMRSLLWGSLLVVLLMAGCNSGRSKGTITGMVKVDGKPLPQGQITFYGEAGAVKGAGILDGKYTITDFPTGHVKVTVQSVNPTAGPVQMPKGLNIPQPPGATESPTKTGSPRPYVPVDPSYTVPDTTPLHYTVVEGQQTKDFDIVTSKKR